MAIQFLNQSETEGEAEKGEATSFAGSPTVIERHREDEPEYAARIELPFTRFDGSRLTIWKDPDTGDVTSDRELGRLYAHRLLNYMVEHEDELFFLSVCQAIFAEEGPDPSTCGFTLLAECASFMTGFHDLQYASPSF